MITFESLSQYYYTISFCFAFIFFSVVLLLFYHGAFYKIEVKATKPPFKSDIFVAYKFTQDYSESRILLSEAQNIAPSLDSFSIYHENFVVSNMEILDFNDIINNLILFMCVHVSNFNEFLGKFFHK